MDESRAELQYEVLHLIGSGGHADVYLLRHVRSGGYYAGKFQREHWDTVQREGFRREAHRQARVGGPHVVPIVGWNFEVEQPFIVLEYMPQGSLADELLRRGRLDALESLRIVRDLAAALVELHAAGVVHRDLKPGNVMRAADGSLKLNDLGIAATVTTSGIVRAEGFMGTLAYAAPEQKLGLACAKSDVYALGVMLREFLTGSAQPSSVPVHARVQVVIDRLTQRQLLDRPNALEAVQILDGVLAGFAAAEATIAKLNPLAALTPWGVLGMLALAGMLKRGSTDRPRDSRGRFI